MEAPKELYIQRYSYGALVPGYANKPVKMADGENIKYIRADLVVEKKKLVAYTTLQQEQPEPSNNLVDIDAVREVFITEVYRVLDADPTNDRANAIIDAFDSLPTIYQEQPEVDLDKEIDAFFYGKNFKRCNDGVRVPGALMRDWQNQKVSRSLSTDEIRRFARRFWNKGYNARREE